MGTAVVQTEHRHWSEHPIVDATRQLGPAILKAAPEIERQRRLPSELASQLTDAGVFQMYQPRSIGGPEVHPLTAFAVVEELARHDGSVGWCTQVSAAVTVFLASLDPAALPEMVELCEGAPLHVAGSARPFGKAIKVDGGYRVTGQWNYASGVRHANWFLATSFADKPDGSVVTRSMLVPVSAGEIVANWDVMGMKGTGSDDFVLDDVFVPQHRISARSWSEQPPGPLYDTRLNMVPTWAPTAGIGTGLARGAIEALVGLGEAASTGSPDPLRTRPAVQEAVAQAEAITSSARAFVVESIEAAWDVLADHPPGQSSDELERAVARGQLAITHSLNEAVRVADLCFHAAGTNAISSANRLERFLRDAHTAVQHAAGQPIHQRVAGRVLLGLDAGAVDPFRVGPSTPKS